jgi:hypothetical protein
MPSVEGIVEKVREIPGSGILQDKFTLFDVRDSKGRLHCLAITGVTKIFDEGDRLRLRYDKDDVVYSRRSSRFVSDTEGRWDVERAVEDSYYHITRVEVLRRGA